MSLRRMRPVLLLLLSATLAYHLLASTRVPGSKVMRRPTLMRVVIGAGAMVMTDPPPFTQAERELPVLKRSLKAANGRIRIQWVGRAQPDPFGRAQPDPFGNGAMLASNAAAVRLADTPARPDAAAVVVVGAGAPRPGLQPPPPPSLGVVPPPGSSLPLPLANAHHVAAAAAAAAPPPAGAAAAPAGAAAAPPPAAAGAAAAPAAAGAAAAPPPAAAGAAAEPAAAAAPAAPAAAGAAAEPAAAAAAPAAAPPAVAPAAPPAVAPAAPPAAAAPPAPAPAAPPAAAAPPAPAAPAAPAATPAAAAPATPPAAAAPPAHVKVSVVSGGRPASMVPTNSAAAPQINAVRSATAPAPTPPVRNVFTRSSECPEEQRILREITKASESIQCPKDASGNPAATNLQFPVTVVTGYYAIRSKHPLTVYLEWLKLFLLRIRTPVAVFSNCETVHMVQEVGSVYRERERRFPGRLYAATMELEFTPLARKFGAVMRDQEARDGEVALGHNFLLYLVWLMKTEALLATIRENRFCSEWFLWVDGGAFRAQDHKMSDWPSVERLALIPSDRVLFEMTIPFAEPEKIKGMPAGMKLDQWIIDHRTIFYEDHLAGGFIGFNVRNDTYLKFYKRLTDSYKMFEERDMLIIKDQSVFHSLFLMYPQMFALIQAHDECGDPWFHAEAWLADQKEYACAKLHPLITL